LKTRRGIWKDRRLLPIAWAGVIVVASSTPGRDLPQLGPEFADKVAHLLEYLVLGVFLLYGFRRRRTLLYGLLFAAADELHQFFIPGRYCSGFDLLADCAGLALSPVLYWLVGRLLRRMPKAN
jgi:VanZ family protein